MEYQGVSSQYYYNHPRYNLQIHLMFLIIILQVMNSHVDVASHNNSKSVASANCYVDNAPHHTHHNHGYLNYEFFEF